MRLVMMGTGGFAVPTFRALLGSRHQVVALVTQPPRAEAGRLPPSNTMREVAHQHAVPVLMFEDINTNAARDALQRLSPDLFVVADYGQILSPETLAVARQGGINLHGSLLPKYRGAAPINWALYHGEQETGVTTIHITPHVDAGPCLMQAKTAIAPDENAVELEHRLAELGAPLVIETIDRIEAGRLEGIPQDPSLATQARRLKKADGRIDWSRSAEQIRNQVRAMVPWPKSYTFWKRAGQPPLRLILEEVAVVEEPVQPAAAPGTVVEAKNNTLVVATGGGRLSIKRLQPAGKRSLAVAEFLRGYPVAVGDTLGPDE
jgi:methionyl-tRNA formyltransferase